MTDTEPTTPAEQGALLERARTIAVVGFSKDPSKPSHRAPLHLVAQGWNVVPINPTVEEVAGMRAYPSLAAAAEAVGQIDLVDVFRPAAEAPEIARQAVEVGASTLWLQRGIASAEARSIATDAGLSYVEDACAGALSQMLDLHPAGS